ncbi:NUDIX hydrolase [Anaerospora sp.]|jgi:ADP-ribose pyrophosphatase|uniref:NUDIX hydrolase n=1 Tax=Anaerospora sp. TaxID=1960278 RepID=UPI00289ED888|nr:NUDIX hydrolase [Anaerospora sp.]MDF2928200.1 hydrolase [Anaerospora sp.]
MNTLLEHQIRSEQLYNGKIINVRRDTVLLPNGKEAVREVVEHPGAVAIVPVLEDGSIVMVSQYRHAAGKILLEIPAGKLDKGEKPESCAARELEEEIGYQCQRLHKLASVYTTPGFSDEIIHIYLAEALTPTEQHLDEDEFLHIATFTKAQVRRLIADGSICDNKTITGLLLAGV